MSQFTTEILNQAYDLIEQDNLPEALSLLKPIVEAEPDNANAWWLYAHAVDDPQLGRDALQKVAELNPNYPGLESLTEQIEVVKPAQESKPTLKKLGNDAPPASIPESLPDDELISSDELDFDEDLDFDDDEFDDDDFSDDDEFDLDFEEEAEEKPEKGGRNRLLLIGVPIAVVAVLGIGAVALLLSSGGGSSDIPTPTNVSIASASTATLVPSVTISVSSDDNATQPSEEPTEEDDSANIDNLSLTATALFSTSSNPTVTVDADPTEVEVDITEEVEPTETDEPTETPEDTPTREPSETPTDEPEANLLDKLTSFDIPEDGINVDETDLGDTLIVSVCVLPGPQASEAMLGIMDIMSENIDDFDVDGIGVEIVDCEADTPLRTIAVSSDDARDYANGDIDQREFQRLWQPAR